MLAAFFPIGANSGCLSNIAMALMIWMVLIFRAQRDRARSRDFDSAYCALLNLRHWNRLATRQSVTFSLRKPETI